MFNLNQQAALGLTQAHLCDFQGRQIEKTIQRDLEQMIQGARKSGITLSLASTFRDFDRQALIWNNKFNLMRPVFDSHDKPVDMTSLNDAEKCFAIMLFSAMPGASRHHFGFFGLFPNFFIYCIILVIILNKMSSYYKGLLNMKQIFSRC